MHTVDIALFDRKLHMKFIVITKSKSTRDKKKIKMGEGKQITGILSKWIICGKFFDSKKQLRTHKDKDHG
jgi:hypothetical protein